jgi:serine/threonine-protein kinase
MAEVFLAVQMAMYRLVAFKWLKNMHDPSLEKMRRFARECEIGARLIHPNVVQFFDAGKERNTYYIIMELVDGETLDKRQKRMGRLPVEEVISIAFQLVEAMDFAYQEHIVHRDIKPSNIFITKNGVVKLADFGLAKYFDEIGLSQEATRSGMRMGTAPFMPPEQFGDAKHVDQRSDIYALGATLYKLLTGQYAIPVKEDAGILEYVRRVSFESPRCPSQIVKDIPADLDRIIMQCLAKKSEERFLTPAEIREALKNLSSLG